MAENAYHSASTVLCSCTTRAEEAQRLRARGEAPADSLLLNDLMRELFGPVWMLCRLWAHGGLADRLAEGEQQGLFAHREWDSPFGRFTMLWPLPGHTSADIATFFRARAAEGALVHG